jgi:GR25 family glycosyltransferase involved in LPS biosynthesis
MTQSNSWIAKARSLDRYRWALLRERHGLFGSVVRFAREALGDWWFGVRAKGRLADSIAAEPCDFLLLQSAPKVIKFQRKKLLIEGLRGRGHNLAETALQPPKVILQQRLLKAPPFSVPTRYFGLAAHAQWLVEHHQPRILLNDRNGSLYSPFLRLALNARGSLLVHLAHATTVEGSRRLGMNDYDYYFLFGQSSLEALQARKLRLGSSIAVLAGSHMIDSAFDLPPADPSLRTILILGVGPDKEKESGYQATYKLLRDWAAEHPDYQVLVKTHPRSDAPFWQQAAIELPNLHVLAKACSLASALAQASLVVNIMSNAVIEAALARRPILYVNAGEDADIFSQQRFLGNRVSGLMQLSVAVEQVANDYASSIERSEHFAEYHLAQGSKGLSNCLALLEQLLAGQECVGGDLPESLVCQARLRDIQQIGNMKGSCFERAYVINLDHRQDRWLQTVKNLEALGIVAERFPAVDVARLNAEGDQPPQALRDFLARVDGPSDAAEHKLMTTWACMRSHLAVIRMAKARGLDSVLILEDDCDFEPYARAVLMRAIKQLQGCSWQMLYLGGTLKKGSQNVDLSENLMGVSRVRLAHAYLVHSSLYDRILNEAPVSGLPLDWYYSERLHVDVRVCMVKPSLAYQRLFDMSDIEQVERRPKLNTRRAIKRWFATHRYGRD